MAAYLIGRLDFGQQSVRGSRSLMRAEAIFAIWYQIVSVAPYFTQHITRHTGFFASKTRNRPYFWRHKAWSVKVGASNRLGQAAVYRSWRRSDRQGRLAALFPLADLRPNAEFALLSIDDGGGLSCRSSGCVIGGGAGLHGAARARRPASRRILSAHCGPGSGPQ